MIAEAKETLFSYSDLKDLRTLLTDWLKSVFTGVAIINQPTGFVIEFNSTSFRKLVSGHAGEVKLLALTALKEMIIYGDLIAFEPDRRNRKDIIGVYKFVCDVAVKNKTYKFYFTVRQLHGGKFIYSGHLDIKK